MKTKTGRVECQNPKADNAPSMLPKCINYLEETIGLLPLRQPRTGLLVASESLRGTTEYANVS